MDKTAKRIQMLIAQAEGTDNAHEAAAFMEAAEELMLRHAISQDQLGHKAEEMITLRVQYNGTKKWWRALGRQGSAAVVNAMPSVGIAISNWDQGVHLYGYRQDVEHARTVLESVWRQARNHFKRWAAADTYYKALRSGGIRAEYHASENAYLLGFCKGVGDKLRQAEATVVSDTTGAELVLRSRKAEVRNYMSRYVDPRRHGGKAVNVGAGSGYRDGYAAGQSATLGAELM